MRIVAGPAALCLTLALQTSIARAADDIIVNGLHCNQFCQSWLGVGSKSGGNAAEVAPVQARRQVSLVSVLPPVQARRTAPVTVASLPTPSPGVSLIDVAPTPAPSLARAATHPPYHMVVRPQAPAVQHKAVLTATREFVPTTVKAPLPRLAPEPSDRIEPLVSAPPAVVRVEPMPPTRAPAAHGDAGEVSLPALDPAQQRGRLASYEVGHPLSAPDDVRPAPQPRAARGPVATRSNARMEPGLTTLPRLDDVVAVHGTIMIETAEDKALAKRQLNDLIKATTRPKQFKTGFIGQPETNDNTSKVATGGSE